MGEDARSVATIVVAEGIKFILMLAFEEARRRGMTDAEVEQLYIDTRMEFLRNDPGQIPEV